MREFDLDRFRNAQDAPNGGFDTALAELRAGRKQSHWIWYVFPQLAGLGQSSTAVHYGLAGAEEAAAYVRDDVLGDRLVAAAAVVRGHVAGARPLRLDRLMGSEIVTRGTRGVHAVADVSPFRDGGGPGRLRRAVQMASIIPYACASSGAM